MMWLRDKRSLTVQQSLTEKKKTKYQKLCLSPGERRIRYYLPPRRHCVAICPFKNLWYLPGLASLSFGKQKSILSEISGCRTDAASAFLPDQEPRSLFSSDLNDGEEEQVVEDTCREENAVFDSISKNAVDVSPPQPPAPSFVPRIALDQEAPVRRVNKNTESSLTMPLLPADREGRLTYQDLEQYATQEQSESIKLPIDRVEDKKITQEDVCIQRTTKPMLPLTLPHTENAKITGYKSTVLKKRISTTPQVDFGDFNPISGSELESNESESLYSLDLEKNDFARSVQQKANCLREKLIQERRRFSDRMLAPPSSYVRSNWKDISPPSSLPKNHLEAPLRDDKFATVEKELGQMYSTRQSLQAQIQSLDEEMEQRRELRDRLPPIRTSGALSPNPSLRELAEINQSLSKQVAETKAEKLSLQRELKRVINAVNEEESEERQFYKNRVKSLEMEVNRALDQVTYMHGEIAKSESEKSQLKMELSNLQFELKTIASKTSNEKEMEQITCKQREEAITRERQDFERRMSEAQKCFEELKNSKEKEIGSLQKELMTARGVIFSLRVEVEDLRRKVTDGNIRYLKLTEQHSCSVDSYEKRLNDLREAKDKQIMKLEHDLRHEMEKKCNEQRAELERKFTVREGILTKQSTDLNVQLEECRLKLEQQSRLQPTPITSARQVQTETTVREEPVRWDAAARWGPTASPSTDGASSMIGGSELWREELKLLRDATQASLQLAQQELMREREKSVAQAATIRCLEDKMKNLIAERAGETQALMLALEDKVKEECSKAEQQFQVVLAKEKAEARRQATEAVKRTLGPQLLQYKQSASQAQKTTRELRRRLEGFYDSVLKLTNKECRKLSSILQLGPERLSLLDTELAGIDTPGELALTRSYPLFSMEDDVNESWEKSIATSMATQSAYISELGTFGNRTAEYSTYPRFIHRSYWS
nr:unnamed protein product [Spirometra erinaceieuropaei]